MGQKIKIGWDVSHQEFTIEDHYYFSILKSNIRESGAKIKEVHTIKDIMDYDVLVLNYPEKSFTNREVKQIKNFIERGKRVIACGYFDNEDRVADNINSIASHFDVSLKKGRVRDKVHNHKGDDLLLVTSSVLSYNYRVKKVLFPCCASIQIQGDTVNKIVLSEKSSSISKHQTILATQSDLGEGSFILIGTCVFWDNYAIKKYGNLKFSLNLILSD